MSDALCRMSRQWGRLAAWLGVLAVLMRCVITPGLMPDEAAAARGVFQLVICTGSGTKALPGMPDAPAWPHPTDFGLCPFAACVAFATAADSASPAVLFHQPVMAVCAPQIIAEATHFRPFAARAPPAFS
jgi:hypothetical protein